jgi:hypothetical protein
MKRGRRQGRGSGFRLPRPRAAREAVATIGRPPQGDETGPHGRGHRQTVPDDPTAPERDRERDGHPGRIRGE